MAEAKPLNFNSLSEAYKHISANRTEENWGTYMPSRTQHMTEGWHIKVYNKFGEYLGILQTDGSSKLDD